METTGLKATFTGTKEDEKLYSPAEWKVFLKYCEGYSKKMIADYVCRSPETIRTQEVSIRKKSGTHTMVHAMAKAVAKGMVTITTLCLLITAISDGNIDDFKRSRRIERFGPVKTRSINEI